MLKCLTILAIMAIVTLNTNFINAQAAQNNAETETTNDNMQKGLSATASDDSDLSNSETFGYGYYPAFYGGYYGGIPRGLYGSGFSSFGIGRRWAYGGYHDFGGYYRRPIYPVWG